MLNTAAALKTFWSSFGLKAYTVNTIPDEQELPYITYSLPETEPLQSATHYAQVWYKSTSNAELLRKVDLIKETIGTGVRIDCDGGYVALYPLTPFAQLQVGESPEERYAYLNMQINCYHL